MSSWGARYVWSAEYIRTKGRTCLVISDLEVPNFFGQTCPIKEVDMSGQIWIKQTWNSPENRLSKDLAYRLIVVHILVIDGEVLKIKTHIGFKINMIIKHA
jgi:hypothetical protein